MDGGAGILRAHSIKSEQSIVNKDSLNTSNDDFDVFSISVEAQETGKRKTIIKTVGMILLVRGGGSRLPS